MLQNIGKPLVVLNVLLSVVFLAWALSAYNQRIDWVKPAGGGADRPAKLDELNNQITALATVRVSDLVRWASTAKALADAEAQRGPRLAWQSEQLKIMEEGTNTAGQAVEPSILELPRVDENGLYDLKAARKAVVYPPGPALLAIKAYVGKLAMRHDEIVRDEKTIETLLTEEQRLTEDLNGDPTGRKGLRELFGEQQAAELASIEEQDYLRAFVANRRAEEQLLLKRQTNLQGRVNLLESELQKRAGASTRR